MAYRYLNESCGFTCSCGMGANFFKIAAGKPSGVKLHKKPILTTSAALRPVPGVFCVRQPNPEGTPPYLPCILSGVGVMWEHGSKTMCRGESALTERSRAICNGFRGELTAIPPVGVTCVQGTEAKAIRP